MPIPMQRDCSACARPSENLIIRGINARCPACHAAMLARDATGPASATMAPGWKKDLAVRCFDGERPSRMNGDP